MKKTRFGFSILVALIALLGVGTVYADEPTKASDVVDTSKLKDAFRKRFDDLVAGDYYAIKASTGLMNALFGTYEEWQTWDRTILAGMPAKRDWAPPTFALGQIQSVVTFVCYGLDGDASVRVEQDKECNKRWKAYEKVTGAMFAWTYAVQNPAHLTLKDAEAALKAAYVALDADLVFYRDVPPLKAWVKAKLDDDKTKADAKILYAAYFTAAQYTDAALAACRYDLTATDLQRALDGIAAAGESKEDAKWTTWKKDALAALNAKKSCWDIGWRYVGPDNECKDDYRQMGSECQKIGSVVLEFPNDTNQAKSLSIY